jgi:hypothetical protein
MGLCTCRHSDAQVSRGRVKIFSKNENVSDSLCEECIYSPHARPRSLMAINVHQVTVRKRLKSHDEQLMFIIPVSAITLCMDIVTVGRGWSWRGLPFIGLCSTAQRKIFLSCWASKPSPEQEPPKSLCSNMSAMPWCLSRLVLRGFEQGRCSPFYRGILSSRILSRGLSRWFSQLVFIFW